MVNTGQPSKACVQCRARRVKVSRRMLHILDGTNMYRSVINVDRVVKTVQDWAFNVQATPRDQILPSKTIQKQHSDELRESIRLLIDERIAGQQDPYLCPVQKPMSPTRDVIPFLQQTHSHSHQHLMLFP